MRTALLAALCVLAGCGKPRPTEVAPDVDADTLLAGYSDAEHQGKHFRVFVPAVIVAHLPQSEESPESKTVVSYTPEGGSRSLVFEFVSEAEALTLVGGKAYHITGRCDGMAGNVVTFRECVARPVP